ncbi:MAG: hypothetical protein CMJ62_14285, partial [Planctomycetaceae bacterium]|nr:hypothetical protein [Planctomycetaceae bacterium]
NRNEIPHLPQVETPKPIYSNLQNECCFIYDHRIDPNEWTNLANKPEHKETKKRLAQMIPTNQHPGLKVQSWFDKYQK